MGLIVRLTRAGLVAMGVCADGVALFDKLAPAGEIRITDPSVLSEALASVPNDYRQWLGPLAAGSGSGDGSGYGYGYGSGSSYGYGYGYGYGDGAGYGYGSGDGYGSGYGSGDGDGAGSGSD